MKMKKLFFIILIFMLTGCGYEINITIKPKDKKEKHVSLLPVKGTREIIIGQCLDTGQVIKIGYPNIKIGHQPAYTGETIYIGYYPSNPPQFPLYIGDYPVPMGGSLHSVLDTTTDTNNYGFGLKALNENKSGGYSTAYGLSATGTFSCPFGIPNSQKNIMIGRWAGYETTTGTWSTPFGTPDTVKTHNMFMGYKPLMDYSGDEEKLYIENANSSPSLIWYPENNEDTLIYPLKTKIK